MDALRIACLVLLGPSTVALLVAGQPPRPGAVRSRVFPLTVGGLSVSCMVLTAVLATRFEADAALPLATAGGFLGLAGRRRHAALAQRKDSLRRQLRAKGAGRPRP